MFGTEINQTSQELDIILFNGSWKKNFGYNNATDFIILFPVIVYIE